MTLTTGFTDSTPGGSSGSPKTGDLSVAITSGLTNATIRITNSHADDITTMWYRDTGTTTYFPIQLMPGLSQDVGLSLPSSNARTFEYYFVGGALQVDVVAAWGTGYSSAVSLADVEAWLTMYGYSISASGDLTSAQVQLCLDRASSEVTIAATRYALIASQTLNSAWKNTIIKDGAVAHALRAIRNKGISKGYEQQAQRVSDADASQMLAEYLAAVERINLGIYYGA